MTRTSASAPQKTEPCALMVTAACKAREGATEPSAGFLVIVDSKPGLVCQDCRAILLRRHGHSERVDEGLVK